MELINQGGKLLLRDGKLGTGQGCCCGGDEPLGTCCEPLCCIFMGVVLWAPNDPMVDPEPPGGWIIPDAVPGYDYRGDGPLGAGWYREYCPDVECDQAALIADFEGAVQSVDPYAGTEYAAVVSPIGAGSRYRNGTEEGVQCGGGVTQSACEEKRGTWYATLGECESSCGFWACCLPDGSCVGLHPADCEEAGGTRGTDRCENYDCENPLP